MPGDFLRSVESQGIVADQVGFGLFKLSLARSRLGKVLDLAGHDVDGGLRLVCPRRRRADIGTGIVIGGKAGADRIGQTAFFADFGIKPRGKRSAAENMVGDIGCDEIGIAALQAASADTDNCLRH